MSDTRAIDKMTVDQLKRDLNAKEIKFPSNALKPALVQLLKEARSKNAAAAAKDIETTVAAANAEKANTKKTDTEKTNAKKPDAEKPDAEKPDAGEA